MYSQDNIEFILKKQQLSQYIETFLVSDRKRRLTLPNPKLAQVVTATSIGDTVYDYPCQFTAERFKKGSYIKMDKWEINPINFEIIIHQAQYLGGAGSEVYHGKRWEHEKLHYIVNAKIFSPRFVIYHEPTEGISFSGLPQFNYPNLLAALNAEEKEYQINMKKKMFGKDKLPEKKTFGKDTLPEKKMVGKDTLPEKKMERKDAFLEKKMEGKDTLPDKK